MDELSLSGQRQAGVIANGVILKSVPLIHGVKPNVFVMQGVKLDEETAVLEARRVKGCAVQESNPDEAPFMR